MTGPREGEPRSGTHGDTPPTTAARATPHGYDRAEFSPGESRRDFPRRRRPGPDEERRLLREAEAAFEGPDRRHDADVPRPARWDRDAGEHLGSGKEASRRLYRE
ncbi:hypothetical protein V5F59_14525 [Xanthobacter autotrophicus DSM 431]|uniref:hypothetical protein n=1 Tax=Xanthobacter nonsaccharivorans TaxID=3119912 RepID=UPI003726CB1C